MSKKEGSIRSKMGVFGFPARGKSEKFKVDRNSKKSASTPRLPLQTPEPAFGYDATPTNVKDLEARFNHHESQTDWLVHFTAVLLESYERDDVVYQRMKDDTEWQFEQRLLKQRMQATWNNRRLALSNKRWHENEASRMRGLLHSARGDEVTPDADLKQMEGEPSRPVVPDRSKTWTGPRPTNPDIGERGLTPGKMFGLSNAGAGADEAKKEGIDEIKEYKVLATQENGAGGPSPRRESSAFMAIGGHNHHLPQSSPRGTGHSRQGSLGGNNDSPQRSLPLNHLSVAGIGSNNSGFTHPALVRTPNSSTSTRSSKKEDEKRCREMEQDPERREIIHGLENARDQARRYNDEWERAQFPIKK